MSRFITLLQLDFTLIIRNRILAVAALITALYAAILQLLPEENFSLVITTLIFTDPVMLGFMFTGVMVLFEKSGNTLQALSVSPVRPGEYLWSKALCLTLIALVAALIMAVAGVGLKFNALYLTIAVICSSLLFVFIGFAGVTRVQTFNQFFIIIPLLMIPGFLPFLNFFGITDTWLWYFIPTQACLLLFTATFDPAMQWTEIQIWYVSLYLPLSIFTSYFLALKMWQRQIQ